MELTDRETLFVAQAFINAVGDMTKTRDPHNLRGQVDAYYAEAYERDGSKSFDAKINGHKVGTYSLTIAKPTADKVDKVFEVEDVEKLKSWKGFKAAAADFVASNPQLIADWHFGNTGELPDGCALVEVVYPGDEGGYIKSSTLKVDKAEVAKALGAELPEAATMLLEGGQDD